MKNKEVVKTKDVDGNDLELAVVRPSVRVEHQAQLEHNKAFAEAVKGGSLLRATLENYMKEQNLWDDAKQTLLESIQKDLLDGEDVLSKGGVKLSEAREVAINMRRRRLHLLELSTVRNRLDAKTAEGLADNHSFNYKVASCTVYNDNGKLYFNGLDDYLGRAGEQATLDTASALANIIYGLDADFEKNLAENKFLLKYKLCNDDLSLVNKEGHLVDIKGRRIDKDGYYLDDNGQRIDESGNQLDNEGNLVVEFKEFLDEDGNTLTSE